MAKKDFSSRESKKPKKDSKRSAASAMPTLPEAVPEVVVKKRPPKEDF